MIVKFLELTLHNFKAVRDLNITYPDVLKLTGKNGESKTSIGEAPIWCLYGVDLMNGSKFDPTPTTYDYDTVSVELLLSKDGAEYLLKREIVNGKNVFYKNEVPVTATEYKAFVDSLFEKEMFLSLYNPAFFFSQKWEDQRKQIMKYVSAPLNADIFAAMSDGKEINPYAKRLETDLKKASIADLKAKHTDNKNKKEDAWKKSQGSVKTIQDQIKAFKDVPDVDLEKLASDNADLEKQIIFIVKIADDGVDVNMSIASLVSRINSTKEQITPLVEQWPYLRDEQIIDTCRTCKQTLPDEAKVAVVADKEKRIEAFKANHAGLVSKRKLLEAELEGIESVDISEQRDQIKLLEAEFEVNKDAIRKQQQKDALTGQLDAAKKLEAEHLASNKDSIFVLDAIKSFNATEASLQVSKVEALFTRLKVRLFNYVESTGEYKPFFMIQMDDKDFSALSQGEKMAAGLELHEVLHKQSGLIVPCFLDNVESYTGEIKVYGQAIISRVVEGQALQINGQEVI
jgi:DNA repair exonuclease SbcCD ATPase subunit